MARPSNAAVGLRPSTPSSSPQEAPRVRVLFAAAQPLLQLAVVAGTLLSLLGLLALRAGAAQSARAPAACGSAAVAQHVRGLAVATPRAPPPLPPQPLPRTPEFEVTPSGKAALRGLAGPAPGMAEEVAGFVRGLARATPHLPSVSASDASGEEAEQAGSNAGAIPGVAAATIGPKDLIGLLAGQADAQ